MALSLDLNPVKKLWDKLKDKIKKKFENTLEICVKWQFISLLLKNVKNQLILCQIELVQSLKIKVLQLNNAFCSQ